MILTIRLDFDPEQKNPQTYQEVVDKLADYDIVSVAWEDEPPKKATPPPGQKSDDLGTKLSQSIDRLTGGR